MDKDPMIKFTFDGYAVIHFTAITDAKSAEEARKILEKRIELGFKVPPEHHIDADEGFISVFHEGTVIEPEEWEVTNVELADQDD